MAPSDILQFANAILEHWVALVTGSLPVMILGIWERFKNKSVSFRFYAVAFLALGFVISAFQAFNQVSHELKSETIKRSQAETQIKMLNDRIADLRHQLDEAQKWIPFQERPQARGMKGVTFENIDMTAGAPGGSAFNLAGPMDDVKFNGIKMKGFKQGFGINSK